MAGGETKPSYDSDFMDEEDFQRYLGGQSDETDSASEIDMDADTNTKHATLLPSEQPSIPFLEDTRSIDNSTRSANQIPFVLPADAVVIDLDTWEDQQNTSLFGGPQSPRVKEEPQEVAAANVLEQLSNLPQEQSVQEISMNDMGGDRAKSTTPQGDSKPSTNEDQYAPAPQTDLDQCGADIEYGNGLSSENNKTLDDSEPLIHTSITETSRPFLEVADSNTAQVPKALPTAAPQKTLLLTKKVRPPLSAAQQATFSEMEKKLAEKAMSNNIRRTVDSTSGGGQPDISTENANNGGSADPYAWMHEVVEIDEGDAAKKFALLKRKYNFKKRKNEATFEDDAAFLRAEKLERARLKRAEDQSRTTTVNNEEEQLFVPTDAQIETPLKRPYSATVETEDDDDDDDLMGNDGIPIKRSKHNPRRKKLEADILNEGYLAAVESQMAKENAKVKKTKKAKKGKPKNKVKGHGKTASKAKVARGDQHRSDNIVAQTKNPAKPQANGVKGKASTKKPDLLRNVNSLFDSDLYAEANAAHLSAPLPVVSATRKVDVLKQLIASVPLEDQRVASEEKKHILAATMSLGTRRVRADGHGGWTVKGMKCSLKNHQIQGVAWMRERETGIDQPLGGLVADEMGFGKTIQMLTCMMSNPPPLDSPSRATLLVAPPALLFQWHEEILKHVQPKALGLVIRYRSGSGLLVDDTMELMQHAGIVLTTYNEVMKSYPRYKPPKELASHEKRMEWWKNYYDEERGMLHRVPWYRVVLDEAQAIKNHTSLTSMGCRGLVAKHRWAMSGTPIQNSVEELYPYFKFLHVRNTGTYEVFKENFCDPESGVGNERLHSYLRQFLIRRTHADRLFGAPLINLPKNNQSTIVLEFNEVERGIYEIVRHRFIKKINEFKERRVLKKSYSHVLTMLLRLRQLTAHPFLLQDTLEDLFEMEDVERMWDATASEVELESGVSARNMLVQMRKMIADKNKNQPDAAASATPRDSIDDTEFEKSRPLVFKFRRYLRELAASSKWQALSERSLCCKCRDMPQDPVVTDCLHLYCSECVKAMAMEAAAEGEDSAACLECGKIYLEVRPCNGLKELGYEDGLAGSDGSSPKPPSKRNPDDDVKWISMEGKMLPSTKTAAMVAQIEDWLKQAPGCKIIIFTQWQLMYTMMSCARYCPLTLSRIRIIGNICAQQGWGYGTVSDVS